MVWDLYGSGYARQTTLRLEQELRDRALQRRATWGRHSRAGQQPARRESRRVLGQTAGRTVLPFPR